MRSFPVRFEKREASEHDGASLLFGDEPSDDSQYESTGAHAAAADTSTGRSAGTSTLLTAPPRRTVQREARRQRRRRRLLLFFVVIVIAAIAASGWVAYKSLYAPKDWTGTGIGTTTIVVNPGDGSSAIGTTLAAKRVIRSAGAYVAAAAHNSKSQDIGPGTYQMRLHMSATAALALLLDPSAHIVAKVTIPEGTIEKDIVAQLATALKMNVGDVTAAADDVANLGVPDGYAPASGPLASAEGFLFPDTYDFDPGTSAAAALQQMAAEFTTEDKQLGFADGAKKIGITPYQALIIASIAQSEVKFAADAPKVARVILNRLATNMPLQIDATSAYAAKLKGLDPAKVIYATIDSPYNSYTHKGLPPTPIGNPGEAMLQAAITPAVGDWLYYVNGDAKGDLFFTSSAAAFEQAVTKCKAEGWGCG
jgi:UPF0755 protein